MVRIIQARIDCRMSLIRGSILELTVDDDLRSLDFPGAASENLDPENWDSGGAADFIGGSKLGVLSGGWGCSVMSATFSKIYQSSRSNC